MHGHRSRGTAFPELGNSRFAQIVGDGLAESRTPNADLGIECCADLIADSEPKTMRLVVDLPRWLFLIALVYAPWAYGTTRDWTIEVFNALILTVIGFWLVGCICRRLRPQIPALQLAAVLFLLLQGWWMILNARSFFDPNLFEYVPRSGLWSLAPGVVDRADSIPIMIRITGLLGITCFVSDLVQRPEWRTRVWWTIGLTGASIALYGLALRVSGAVMVNQRCEVIDRFFAGYRYSANAGAYLNLVLPTIAGLAIVAFGKRGSDLQRALWAPCLLICLAGAVAAASKAAIVITALLILVFAIRHTIVSFKQRQILPSALALVVGLLAVTALALGVAGIGWGAAMEKWTADGISQSWDARWLCYDVCTHMLGDAGAWGFGPGTFRNSFPDYTGYLGNRITGIWQFAHQDYLQTLIEWGWIGASVWAVLFFGGMAHLWRKYLKEKRALSAADRMLLFASFLALLGVAAHALVDFPLQIASLQLYAATYVGIAWSSSRWSRSQ